MIEAAKKPIFWVLMWLLALVIIFIIFFTAIKGESVSFGQSGDNLAALGNLGVEPENPELSPDGAGVTAVVSPIQSPINQVQPPAQIIRVENNIPDPLSLRGLTVSGDISVFGNIGVGTNLPSSRLDVRGSIKASEFCFLNGNCISSNWNNNIGAVGAPGITSINRGDGLKFENIGGTSIGTIGIAGGKISVDTNFIQRRVSESCGGNEAIRSIDGNGRVSCVSVNSSVQYINSNDNGQFQRRVFGDCPTGYAIRRIDQNGSVSCEFINYGNQGASYPIIDTSIFQRMITSSCPVGYAIRSINNSGGVTCEQVLVTNSDNIDTSIFQRTITSSCPTGYAIRAINNSGGVTCEQVQVTNSNNNGGNTISITGPAGSLAKIDSSNSLVGSIISEYFGRIGIGVATGNPEATLDVNGTIKVRGGNPGNNKLLTSDGSGNATWRSFGELGLLTEIIFPPPPPPPPPPPAPQGPFMRACWNSCGGDFPIKIGEIGGLTTNGWGGAYDTGCREPYSVQDRLNSNRIYFCSK